MSSPKASTSLDSEIGQRIKALRKPRGISQTSLGRDRVRIACTGTNRPWNVRVAHLSQRFTTRWAELLTV